MQNVLASLIQDVHQQVSLAQQQQEAQRQAELDRIQASAIKQFRQDLTFALGADLLDALPLRDWAVKWATRNGSPNPEDGGTVSVHFTDPESGQWVIKSAFGRGTGNPFGRGERAVTRYYDFHCFKIWWNRYNTYCHTKIGENVLREKVLYALGEARIETLKQNQRKTEEDAQRQRDYETQQQQREANRKAREAQEQAERERRAEINRVHEEIERLIATRREEALASMWQWKDGATITFYTVRWVSGAGVAFGDYDEPYCQIDHDSGYTLADRLDADGWIELLRPNGAVRRVKLDMHAHKPVWEAHTASSITDLPGALRESLYITVEGIVNEWTDYDTRRWQYADGESAQIQVAQDVLPVQWVRDLVDGVSQ